MVGIAITIMIGALVLYGVSGLVRRSGASHILTIDYAKIGDPVALHHWAAGRLRGIAVASMVLAAASLTVPALGNYLLVAFCLLVLAGAISVGVGARRFERA